MSLIPPKSSQGLAGAAEAFCVLYCRQPDDSCPFGWTRKRCPLWQFVQADLPTTASPPPKLAREPEVRMPACPAPTTAPQPLSSDGERIAAGDFDPEEGYDWPNP